MNRLFGTSKAQPNPAPKPAEPVQEQKTYDLSEVAKKVYREYILVWNKATRTNPYY